MGSTALAVGLGASGLPMGQVHASEKKPAEDFVQLLYESLTAEQKQAICFPFDHPLLSRYAPLL